MKTAEFAMIPLLELPFAFVTHGGALPRNAVGEVEEAAMNWFVLAHLGFFFLLLGCFGWGVWRIWQRTTRPEPHVALLMSLEEEPAAAEGETVAQPWERRADWWKQAGD
jgi:hypothetical protein